MSERNRTTLVIVSPTEASTYRNLRKLYLFRDLYMFFLTCHSRWNLVDIFEISLALIAEKVATFDGFMFKKKENLWYGFSDEEREHFFVVVADFGPTQFIHGKKNWTNDTIHDTQSPINAFLFHYYNFHHPRIAAKYMLGIKGRTRVKAKILVLINSN